MSINLHTSLLLAAQQATDEVKKEVASFDSSMDEGKRNIRAIEALANKVLPIFEKNRAKILPQKTAPGLIRDYAARYPALKPFIAQLFPGVLQESKTRVFVKCDAGLGHHLFIRGTARGLSWDHGVQMRCIHDDLWVWETDQLGFEYKIVLDDDDKKRWEDKEGNRFKQGKEDEIIAPTFSHCNKNENSLSEEEISLNRIYKAQAVIERGVEIDYLHDDRQRINLIKEMMGILGLSDLALPNENTKAENYALQCLLKYPFSAPFLFQLFPDLPIEQITHLHPDSLKDPAKLATHLAELWKNKKIPRNDKMLLRCFAKIGEVFAGCVKQKKLGAKTLIKILVQSGELKTLRRCVSQAGLNAPIAFELAMFEATQKTPPFLDIEPYSITDSKALFEIFLIAIAHRKDSIESLHKYSFIQNLYHKPIQACEDLKGKFTPAQICQLLASFCESQKWGSLDPVFKEILAIKNVHKQKAAFINLIHFLGCCALEGISPESFSYILDKHIIQALLSQQGKTRRLLISEILPILKDPHSHLEESSSVYPLFVTALVSRLIGHGMSEQTALKMHKADAKCASHLLDFLAELIDSAPYTKEEMHLIEQRLATSFSNPLSLSSDLEALTNLLSVFGKDTFIECMPIDRELKTLFLQRLQALLGFNDTREFETLYGPRFNNIRENKTLITKLKKINRLPASFRTRAMNALNDLIIDFNALYFSWPKDVLDPKIAKMTAEIFSCKGFTKDAERDKGHELRKEETVSEAQGTSALCEKTVQLSKETPAVLSPKYLRSEERLDPTRLTMRYKRLGHVFNKNTHIYLPDGEMRLTEGFNETFCLNMLRASFDEFASERKDIIPKEMYETVAETLSKAVWNDNVSDEKIAEIHQNIHDPSYAHSILVGSGWEWHSTQIVFRRIQGKLYMFYCNRGADCGDNPGIIACCIEKEDLVTPEFLKRIASRLLVKHGDYTSLTKISEELGAPPIQRIAMKEQKVGNCVYTSLKAAILALLIVSDLTKNLEETSTPILPLTNDIIKKAGDIYKAFSKYDAEAVLEDFLIELNEVSIDLLLSEKNAKYLLSLNAIVKIVKQWLSEQKDVKNRKIGAPLMLTAQHAIARHEKRVNLSDTIKTGR